MDTCNTKLSYRSERILLYQFIGVLKIRVDCLTCNDCSEFSLKHIPILLSSFPIMNVAESSLTKRFPTESQTLEKNDSVF